MSTISISQAENIATSAATVASIATANPEILALAQAAEYIVNALISLSTANQKGMISDAAWNSISTTLKSEVSSWQSAK